LGLNSGLHTFETDALSLEAYQQLVMLWLFWR
jgi:hypothetical protein